MFLRGKPSRMPENPTLTRKTQLCDRQQSEGSLDELEMLLI